MNVKRFFANTSREALRKVRDSLGGDALLLSNRTTDGGVEILAIANGDMSAIMAPNVDLSRDKDSPRVLVSHESRSAEVVQAKAPAAAEKVRPSTVDPQAVASLVASDVLGEIRSMRGMLEEQLAEMAWSEGQRRQPARGKLLRHLMNARFSAQISRYLLDHIPNELDEAAGLTWLKAQLARNVQVCPNENEVLEKGGVYALVGPTGVGKTTTTAKLAARCVVRHGADKLALLTTDGYRIGGHEQLRIYGKILGVTVHAVKDAADLRLALAELRGKHMVLIDTVGMSQRDRMVAEHVSMLNGCGADVKRLLLLNATSHGDTLEEVVRAYGASTLTGAIITKLDEAVSLGSVVDSLVRHRLPLYYVANGQRVPEDLHVANRQYLGHRAFMHDQEEAQFAMNDDEYPFIMASAKSTAYANLQIGEAHNV